MQHSLLMHKIALYCLLFLPVVLFAENPALVAFSDLNYEEALLIGKEQNKLIFINYNAEDVDPCRIMEETTFSNREVINLLNANFVNIDANIDQQVGKEWIKKFGVECLPTFMVLDNNGKLEGINQGTLSTPAFIKWLTNMSSVKLKIEETRNSKETIKKQADKSDNLLAIKRKLKAAEGNYVNARSEKTELDDKITADINSTDLNKRTSENSTLIANETTTEITVLNSETLTENSKTEFVPEKVRVPHVENLENTSLTRTMSYSIQIGAFANYLNAKNIMEKSKHDFEKHYYILEEPTKSGKFLYKVVVGTYTSKEEAQVALQNLVDKGYDGFLRRI